MVDEARATAALLDAAPVAARATGCLSEDVTLPVSEVNGLESETPCAVIAKIPRDQMATLLVETDLGSDSLIDLLELLSFGQMIPFSVAIESKSDALRYGFDVLRPTQRDEAALLANIRRGTAIKSAVFEPIITPEAGR